MSRRSQVRNQFETQLSGTLAAGSFTMAVNSTAGFEIDQPIYLSIDPDVPGKREWVRVISITGNTFNIDPSPNDHGSDGRNLAGSVGDVEHLTGAKVRSVSTEQIYLDIFQDAEDDELDLTQHETDGGDPHVSAGYLKQSDTDLLYVSLVGDTMTGDLILFQDPALALGAATKQYVDGQDHDHATPIAAHTADADAHHVKTIQTFLHGDLTDVSANQHHTKFTEAEAATAARSGQANSIGSRPLIDYNGGGADKSIADSLFTVLDIFISEVADPDNLLSDNQTFTAPEDGLYQMSAAIEFVSNSTGQRGMRFDLTGGRQIARSDIDNSAGQDWLSISGGAFLSQGDTVEVFVNQSSGDALLLDNSACRFTVVKVSD